jgi:hypothetical protein
MLENRSMALVDVRGHSIDCSNLYYLTPSSCAFHSKSNHVTIFSVLRDNHMFTGLCFSWNCAWIKLVLFTASNCSVIRMTYCAVLVTRMSSLHRVRTLLARMIERCIVGPTMQSSNNVGSFKLRSLVHSDKQGAYDRSRHDIGS